VAPAVPNRTEFDGAIPLQPRAYNPHGFGRHLRLDNEQTEGKRRPGRDNFYKYVAATLHGAREILILGSDTGENSPTPCLLADLKRNHSDVAKHGLGAIVVDAYHQTEDELLAKGREFFASKGA
jgi:hypothetical protein